MFKNLKIGVRLSLLVAILCAFMLAVGFIGLRGMQAGDAALDTVYNDRVVPLRDLKIIADMYAVNVVDTAHKARNGNLTHAEAKKNIDIATTTIRQKWHDYLATYLVEEEKALTVQAEPLMTVADREISRLRAILENGDADALAKFTVDSLYPAIDPVSDIFSSLVNLQIKVAKDTYDANQVIYDASRTRMIALIVGALVLGVGIGIATIRSITGPLAYASGLIASMAEGKLDIEVTDDGRRDEAGRMIRATAQIAATLKGVSVDLREMIDAAKAGALSTRTDPTRHRGEFAAQAQGVNDLVDILTAPLFEVAAVMAKLASGDVRGRITGAYDGDLRALKGNVNRSLDALVALLDEISGFAAAMAERDITVTIDGSYQGDFAAIKANLNTAVEQFGSVVREVAESTQQVAHSAGETSAAALDVSRQAADQMNTLTDVSSAIEQMVAAVGEIAQSAERGSALARSAAATAEEGQAKLGNLTTAVDQIAASNARISQISGLIASIAEKTYVLAVNAGLEAVRAGDQGRGFGLIAHQVTKLAEDVAQATRDIRELLEATGHSVQTGVTAAQEARGSIRRIVEASQENGATAQAIAAAIDEQNATAQVLKDRVISLTMVGQRTAGAAEEISATMSSLTDMAQRLKGEIDRLKVA
jgi:methyl-accepting chemotaxis protein